MSQWKKTITVYHNYLKNINYFIEPIKFINLFVESSPSIHCKYKFFLKKKY
jgi:hypothetical protein